MQFLLRKKYNVLSNYDNFEIISCFFCFISFLAITTHYSFNVFENKAYDFILYFVFSMAIYILTYMLLVFLNHKINIYRKKTPYEINTIFENKKKLTVESYPIFRVKKYYYKGKLHREDSFAIESGNSIYENQYYLFGKKIGNIEFNKKKKTILLKNNIQHF
jgi:hypothetical protein